MATGKKKFNKVILYVILIVAILTAAAYLLLTGPNSPFKSNSGIASTPTPNYELVQIVVASQSISRGSVITSNVLTTIRYPKTALPQGIFFLNIEDAVGTKAKYNIDPGVPITTSMLIHEGAGSLASFDIPSGMTAYSIPASPETAVAYAPQKGDHVMVVGCILLSDVDTSFQTVLPNYSTRTFAAGAGVEGYGISTSASVFPLTDGTNASTGRFDQDPTQQDQLLYVLPSESQRPRLVCQSIIQDAVVLNVGMFPLTASEAGSAPTPTPAVAATKTNATIGQNYPGSVTLVVSPQDSIVLNYLLLSGAKLSMALKSAGDTAKYNTDPVTLQYIMDEKNIPSPVKLPYGISPRVDTLTYPSFNDYILLQP
jgi:Flp pilus assembly protein CpaB